MSVPVGGFVIFSGKNPWYSSGSDAKKPKQKEKKTRRRRRTNNTLDKEVIHEIFSKAAEHTDDYYWINVLKSMSVGKLPRSFRYANGFLTHVVNRKSKMIELNINDPASVANDTIKFIQERSNTYSMNDKKKRNKQIRDAQIEAERQRPDDDWKTCGNATEKRQKINRYVNTISSQLGLNAIQSDQLKRTINCCIFLKRFTEENIKMEKGKIVHIDGLTYDTDNILFGYDKSLCPEIKRVKDNVESKETVRDRETRQLNYNPSIQGNVSFNEKWTKFAKSLPSRL